MEGSRQPFSTPVSPASMASEITAFEQTLTDTAAAGPDDSATLAARARLGRAYAFAGRFDDAVSLLRENVAASERALGADHPDAIMARSDLAWAWRIAGYLPEALAAHENCVADLDRVLGPGNALAARARIDDARLLTLMGQHDLARQLLEPALADLIRTVGPEHPDTLCCQLDLAAAYRATDRAGEAVALAERTAADYERLLGPDDPAAISSRAALGGLYHLADRSDEAVALLEAARADFHRVLGPEHTESIRAGALLATVLRAGHADRATAELEQTLTVAERVLVPQHRLVISARLSLARSYRDAGRPADAVPLLEHAIRDFRPASRADVTRLLGIRLLLAGCLAQAGRTTEGITTTENLVAELEQAGEPADTMAVDSRLALAALYSVAARHAEAARAYRAVLPDVRRVYGPDHQKTREVERNLRRARRLRAFPAARHPVVGGLIAAVALAAAVALTSVGFATWPRSHALAPPPKPGYSSPATAVAGYTAAFFTTQPAAACDYTVPSYRAVCAFGISIDPQLAELTGRWTIGHTVVSGSRAIVDVEYQARGVDGGSLVNTDPDAGLPHAGLSFDAAYHQVFTSRYYKYATDCVLLGGLWYVDEVASSS